MNANAEQKTFSSFSENWRRFVNRLRDAVNFAVPFGYEDEAGFHYGADPVRIEVENK